MTERADGRWRIALWGGAALLLIAPALAMEVTDEVNWGLEDFAALGAMLIGACGAFELVARLTRDPVRRAAAGVAIVGVFLLVWAQLAVGILPL